MADTHLINLDEFGRRLRAARILAGHDTVAAAAQAISDSGVPITERTLGAMERGEQMPNLEQFVALELALHPPGGGSYWAKVLPEHLRDMWQQVHGT